MDNQSPSQPTPGGEPQDANALDEMKEGTSTTRDINEDASEALKRFEVEQQAKRQEQAGLGYAPIEDAANVSIEVQSAMTPLVITFKDEIVIGRRDPATQDAPEVDLSPYGAYQMGISRRHAIIRLRSKRLEVYDLGSRNGTYVNGKRLTAHQPVTLSNGATVRIGKLEMKIYVRG